jgi:demethylmenaquinone methyltransferase/2-methoxy-6-polyprenyl-1,4-benzoquinol methylase
MQLVKPYNTDRSKKDEVAAMFDNISGKYDFLNHFLSLGIDKLWRKKAVKMLKPYHPKIILDVATGTGDFAIEALKLKPEKIIGIDISAGMLEKGKQKMQQKNVSHIVEMIKADSENLPFSDNTFDALTVAFGIRNFENLHKGLTEMLRVVKPAKPILIIEFSKPKKFPVKQVFGFYSKTIIPKVGKAISKDTAAYQYLPDSVAAFPEGDELVNILQQIGYKNVMVKSLSGGIASIYIGVK